MKRRNKIMTALVAILWTVLTAERAFSDVPITHTRTRDLCFDWKFVKGDPEGAELTNFDDSAWHQVNIPHDWSIGGPPEPSNPGGTQNGFFPGGIGWYRKHFRRSPNDEGKRICVNFDGVYQNSEVWINGHSLGRRPYGYASFQYDLTPHINSRQDNVIAVRVDNSDQPNCRWYTGSGIYRRVYLTVTDKLHVKNDGTYVTTPRISHSHATVHARIEVQNSYTTPQECTLLTRLFDSTDKVIGESITTRQISGQAAYEFDQTIEVHNPDLWSIEKPNLHRMRTIVKNSEQICDEYITPFGIRQASFDKDRGFLLNSEQIKLKGVCIHHDGGSLGAAVPYRAWERRLQILKSIGCNAIRTSHNPPSPELLDLCDQLGFLVIDEFFDKWDAPYGKWFQESWQIDLADTVRRDRNHPSVIVWSVGNEVSDQGSPQFLIQLKSLVDLTRAMDPTRQVTCALKPAKISSREKNAKTVASIARMVDVISCNYQEQWFEDYRKESPDIVIIASESYPYYRGKGLDHKAFKPLNPWLEAATHDYVAGTFYWTGIDYLGEAVAGWPYHGWNCSLIDTCGYVRPFANLHKSFWTTQPMVHVAVMDESLDVPAPVKDHWGWPKIDSHWSLPGLIGKQVKVVTFSNCPAVELLINGKSMGQKRLEDFPDKMITWIVPYEAGRIEARGFENGQVGAAHELRTAGEATRISLHADRKEIGADGQDLCYVDVQITDKNGTLVPSAAQHISFSIEGPGAIVGVDNGDLTGTESYKGHERNAFHGRAQVIVQSTRAPGTVVLKAQAAGLSGAQIEVNAR